MDTPGFVLQDVYHSARDVVRIERPLATPLTLPDNFGCVLPGVFRSAFPQTQDYAFLRGLKLKTIVTLVNKDLPEGFAAFMKGSGIKHQIFSMEGTKKADIPLSMMLNIVSLVTDRRNCPLLIHCNHGRHRTGCAVAVVRKFNGWDTASILNEYAKYAAPKPREADVAYISNFKLKNLRHVVARKVKEPEMGFRHFLFLFSITIFGIFIWLVTLKNLKIRQARKEES
ncbi:tyrosine phosphatase family-domain-containing protein [Pseudomassariella vexata]|uniref:Tyrosine phosphatase family-domain-containing protein n=1 Tax=Pseudomassariella vexata TaxID=1141098 RepID=A0A1Y2DY78_9PEZI|nr:tyrosine phosphatase family-domain-containing protein [Pseudomassariella vexata]ORY64203.1 tyrosine phosphatase family-domain-containing protein [Pseudomassariella vexata]